MFKTLKASETLGWHGITGITGINGIPVFTPPPPDDVTTASLALTCIYNYFALDFSLGFVGERTGGEPTRRLFC
jgi:hypothetical protein